MCNKQTDIQTDGKTISVAEGITSRLLKIVLTIIADEAADRSKSKYGYVD